jgi:oligopeptide/dipeptide ABC transporter ATP-binding protein
MGAEQKLVIRGLKVGFEVFRGFIDVLDLDELSIARGEAYGLVGESGAGKTVLALAVLGLLQQPPATVKVDELRLGDVDLPGLSTKQLRSLRGRAMAMIFQDPMSALDPVYNIRAQMTDVIRRRAGVSRKVALQRAVEYMSLVELPDPATILEKYPHQLSGGQRQRVIIALALACGADLLIADEPTRNLDVTVQASILQTIDRLRAELGVSLLFIANNLGLVSAMCDRVGILLKGRIVETGLVRDVVTNPLHPYTLELLRAVPRRGDVLDDTELGGLKKDTSHSGCAFYDRCESDVVACGMTEAPRLTPVSKSHSVACPVAVSAQQEVRSEALGDLEGSASAEPAEVVASGDSPRRHT